MPPPRKTDLLPAELREWLKDALEERGFAGYEDLSDQLNARLEAEGFDLRIQKSAIHSFGQEHKEFIKLQEEAGAWAQGWLTEEGLESEAQRHSVLFQMITTLAFKFLKGQMDEGADPDPKELHFIGRLMKDLMQSSGVREKLLQEERDKAAAAARQAAASDVEQASKQLGLTGDTVRQIKARILGVS